MKKKIQSTTGPAKFDESDIRDYAYHLYCQGGYAPGHDLENWFEAEACLAANIPKEHSRGRLHRHANNHSAETLVALPGFKTAVA